MTTPEPRGILRFPNPDHEIAGADQLKILGVAVALLARRLRPASDTSDAPHDVMASLALGLALADMIDNPDVGNDLSIQIHAPRWLLGGLATTGLHHFTPDANGEMQLHPPPGGVELVMPDTTTVADEVVIREALPEEWH